jgi:hypothetical protein
MVSFSSNDAVGSGAQVFAAPGLCAFYGGEKGRGKGLTLFERQDTFFSTLVSFISSIKMKK